MLKRIAILATIVIRIIYVDPYVSPQWYLSFNDVVGVVPGNGLTGKYSATLERCTEDCNGLNPLGHPIENL